MKSIAITISSFFVFTLIAFIAFTTCGNASIPAELVEDPPTYCSSVTRPQDQKKFIQNREIPKLNTSVKDAQLKQVQVLIRHGSRALFEPFQCWSGYQSQYDCRDIGEVATNFNPGLQQFTFAKSYDARPDMHLPNSCLYGQLVQEGYKQHTLTGEILGKTYFTGEHPLVDVKKALEEGRSLEDKFFFRATEFERTRMSGAQLLSSLIRTAAQNATGNPQIKLHTVDFFKESLMPNGVVCPELTEIHSRAFQSNDYLERFAQRHAKARELADRMFKLEETQPNAYPKQVFDCLYTSICGGHDVPEGFTPDEIKTILSAADEEWQYEWRFNNGEFSKKALSRLFVEVKGFMMKMIPQLLAEHGTGYDEIFKSSPVIRDIPFVLWSAHDSTVQPFLTTFGEQMWNATGEYGNSFPPYASMITLELYQTPSQPMIRLVFNSKVLTKHIEGCPPNDDLCPIDTFFKATSWATPEEALRGCKLKKPVPNTWKFTVKMNVPKAQNLRQHTH